MADYLAGLDVGTTGTRCMIFDLRGRPWPATTATTGPAILGQAGWSNSRSCDRKGDASLPLRHRGARVLTHGASPPSGSPRNAPWRVRSTRTVTPYVPCSPGRMLVPGRKWKIVPNRVRQRYYEKNGLPWARRRSFPRYFRCGRRADLFSRTAGFVQNRDIVLRAFAADEFYTDRAAPSSPVSRMCVVRARTCVCWSGSNLSPEMSVAPRRRYAGGNGRPRRSRQTGMPQARRCAWGRGTRIAALGDGATEPGLATVTWERPAWQSWPPGARWPVLVE